MKGKYKWEIEKNDVPVLRIGADFRIEIPDFRSFGTTGREYDVELYLNESGSIDCMIDCEFTDLQDAKQCAIDFIERFAQFAYDNGWRPE